MKLAMFGGSFNPLHIGHAMLGETLVKECSYDKVLFVPTFVPPHKEIACGIQSEDRLNMVKAFCNSVPDGIFECEPCEFLRGGVSYTIDTVKYLYKKYDGVMDGKIGLVMGEEIGAEFPKWKNASELITLCDLIIAPRNNSLALQSSENTLDQDEKIKNRPVCSYKGDFKEPFSKEKLEKAGFPCRVLKDSLVSVSSTEIRSRIVQEKSWRYLVPNAVFDYIEAKALYRN